MVNLSSSKLPSLASSLPDMSHITMIYQVYQTMLIYIHYTRYIYQVTVIYIPDIIHSTLVCIHYTKYVSDYYDIYQVYQIYQQSLIVIDDFDAG